VNDNAPAFAEGVDGAVLTIVENSDVFSEGISTLSALDADGDELTYTIVPNTMVPTAADDLFRLDSTTGLLEVDPSSTLDFELLAAAFSDVTSNKLSVKFDIQVSDGDSSATASIVVKIQDANEHRPQFDETAATTVTMSAVAPKYTKVMTLMATDEDASVLNSDIQYSIAKVTGLQIDSTSTYFEVEDGPDGQISAAGDERYVRLMTSLRPGTYNLQITAKNAKADAAGDAVCTTAEESVSGFCETAMTVKIMPFLQEMPGDPSKLEINWQLPDIASVDRPASFQVWYSESEDGLAYPAASKLNVAAGAETFTFDNLRPSHFYQFSLRAFSLEAMNEGSAASYDLWATETFAASKFGPSSVVVSADDAAEAVSVEFLTADISAGEDPSYYACHCERGLDAASCCTANPPVQQSGRRRRQAAVAGVIEIPYAEVGDFSSDEVQFVVMLQVTSRVDSTSSRIYSVPAFLSESVNFGAGFASVGAEDTVASSMSGAGAAGVVILVLLLIFGLLGFYLYVQNSRKGGADLGEPIISEDDREAIDLAPLKKKIFEDSTEDTAGAPVLPQAEAGAENAEGYWDYFAKERENQFFPGGAGAMPAYSADAPGGYMANPYGAAGDSKAAGTFVPGDMPMQDPATLRTDRFRSAFGAAARTNSTINAADIVARIEEMKATGVIEAEFAQIKQDAASFDATFTAAGEDYNKRKNRYMNVRPIDNTRVKLSHSGQLGGDYINANYVSGWQRSGQYIATQGPIQGTIHDFWRMVWEEKCGVIVMVTKLTEGNKLKCHQYWPDENGSIQCGTLEVLYSDYDDSNPDLCVRKLTLRSSMFNESREVIQYQVKTWPDQGVPENPAAFLQSIHTVRDAQAASALRGMDGPIVTHCSAGIGRTGTFIAVDTTLRRLLAAGNIDMLSTVSHMRQERAGSVQTIAQYKFAYEALKQYVVLNGVQPVAMPTAVVADDEELTAQELNQLRQLAGEDTGATDAELFEQVKALSLQ